MRPSLACLSALSVLVSGISGYSTNYTSQLLSSGTIKLGDWQDAYDRAVAFVDTLNTTQKIDLITGSSVSNFTALYHRDSGDSILDYFYVTTWPLSSSLGMTWDKDYFYKMYKGLGDEMYAKGVNVANGPVSEPLGRTPWGGRNGESFGPDSYLNGIAFGKAVKGFADAGVIAGAKHFLLNEQENNRTVSSGGGGGGGGGSPPSGRGNSSSSVGGSPPSGSGNSSSSGGGMSGGNGGGPGSSSSSSTSVAYSANADDKTLHETYLWPFYDGVKSGLGAAMCSLQRVNETYACENQALLAGFLKTELGFPGFVFGDVGGQKTAFGSANAGMDFSSTSTWSESIITVGLNNGSLTQARLTDMAVRNVLPSYYLNQQDGTYPSEAGFEDYVDARKNHSKIARQIAADSLILLKNEGALPIKAPKSMAIFGTHAGPANAGPNDPLSVVGSDDVHQGHAATLGGSGIGSFAYLVDPHYALTGRIMEDGTQFRYLMNDTGYSSSSSSGTAGYSSGTGASHTYTAYAADAEVCIVFLNAYSGEGADRGELYNTDQDAMVTSVASECNNTVVVINTVAARLVDNWIENENVTALLYGGMLGQESGFAITDVLYGDVNPSGKLTYTIAKNESDYNVGLCDTETCEFTEGNYIDYKYFDAYNVTPRYEFGYGLSYTTFSYSSSISAQILNASSLSYKHASGALAIGGREDLWDIVATVSASVTNTGSRPGAEVAQLYISYPSSAHAPVRQLRGFEKLALGQAETGTAVFELRRRDLSYWDVEAQEWALASGEYEVWVGASSRNLKASTTITVELREG